MERPDAKGMAISKRVATGAKKSIIAKKMGGAVVRPDSWSKKVETRNKEHELDAVMFTGNDKKKEKMALKQKNNDSRDAGGKDQFLN